MDRSYKVSLSLIVCIAVDRGSHHWIQANAQQAYQGNPFLVAATVITAFFTAAQSGPQLNAISRGSEQPSSEAAQRHNLKVTAWFCNEYIQGQAIT